MSRYIVVDKSVSGHCCFEYSVVEASTKIWNDVFKCYFYDKPVCETFEEEDAQLICKLLNEANNENTN